MLTLTNLFAAARGAELRPGSQRCFYCGAACDETYSASDWVKDTCTIRQYAAAPLSRYVCAGCSAAFSECVDVQVFGESAPRPAMRVRLFSWIVTEHLAVAATKAHLAELRRVCLDPPEPPFGVVLSDSGQKHLLYLGRVNRTRESVSVLLEEERIEYAPAELAERLELVKKLCAATGKPALGERPNFNFYLGLEKTFGSVELAEEWEKIWATPLSRLAAWLCPNREESRNECGIVDTGKSGQRTAAARAAVDGGIQAAVSGTLF